MDGTTTIIELHEEQKLGLSFEFLIVYHTSTVFVQNYHQLFLLSRFAKLQNSVLMRSIATSLIDSRVRYGTRGFCVL